MLRGENGRENPVLARARKLRETNSTVCYLERKVYAEQKRVENKKRSSEWRRETCVRFLSVDGARHARHATNGAAGAPPVPVLAGPRPGRGPGGRHALGYAGTGWPGRRARRGALGGLTGLPGPACGTPGVPSPSTRTQDRT